MLVCIEVYFLLIQ